MRIHKQSIYLILIILLFSQGVLAVESKTEEPLVTMMLFETDLREALNEISLQTGVVIIPDQTVGGVVTADLQEVPLKKALDIILAGGGYTFRRLEDYYLVGLPNPKSLTFSKLSELEIINLLHITVDEVLNLLPPYLRSYVQASRERNIITVNAPPAETEKIIQFIEELDKPQKQVEVKVIITELDSKKVRELGLNLLNHAQDGAANKAVSYDMENNLLVLEADFHGQLISKLKLLEEKQQAKIEADPRILVADGESANLFIGGQQVILMKADDGDVDRIEEIDVGVGLQLTADILGENQIRLKLAPEISHFMGQVRDSIVIKENVVSTTLQMKSGQTVALAGMTMRDESTYESKIPGLGDIPLIRWLFKNQVKSESDKELMIFVTPVVK